MQPPTATAELSGQAWRRVAIVVALVSTLAGGVAAVAGRTTASEPVVSEVHPQAPWDDPSCRELIALPKRGWVCERHRP
jgi:hypothetical protein